MEYEVVWKYQWTKERAIVSERMIVDKERAEVDSF